MAGLACPSWGRATAHTALGSAALKDDTNYYFSLYHAKAGWPHRAALTQALPAWLALPAGRGRRKRLGTAAAAPVTP